MILIAAFSPGGSAREALLLAREFRQSYGLDAEVWALQDGALANEFQAAGVPVRAVGFRRPQCPVSGVRFVYWASRLTRVVRELRKARVKILFPISSWPNLVAGLTYRLAGVEFCAWGERLADRASGERFVSKRYRHFIANSAAGVEYLASKLAVPRERILLIRNAVEEQHSDSAGDWRMRLGMQPAQRLVVQVGDVDSRSDWQTLLQAWRIVQDHSTTESAPLLIVAGRLLEAYPECRRLVRDSHLGASIRFVSWIPDAGALIAAADLAVFSMARSFLPNTVLECMIRGKAVVGCDAPGIREAVGPAAGESLTPPGNPGALAEKILNYLASDTARESLGRSNQERVRTEFSVRAMAERYTGLIRTKMLTERAEANLAAGPWQEQFRK